MPSTLQLGSYSLTTDFNCIQHLHAGAPTSYMDALEVEDPPEGRNPIVLVHYVGGPDWFYEWVEWQTVEDAARECNRLEWGARVSPTPELRFIDPGYVSPQHLVEGYYSRRPGFLRYVRIDHGRYPWFFSRDPDTVVPEQDWVWQD
jgi:hypothetical protein